MVTVRAPHGSTSWLNAVPSQVARVEFAPLWLGAVLLMAAALRFVGLDWDQSYHLHPDERFLTSIESALRWPTHDFLATYFSEARSGLNPPNLGFGFFVYGDLPVLLVGAVARLLHRTGFDQVYLVGRVMEALADLGTVALVYVLGRRLYRDHRVGLIAALLYALSPLAIQQAHFFVVDGFSVLFLTAALIFMAGIIDTGSFRDYALAGTFTGVALACKFSTYPLGEVLLVVSAVWLVGQLRQTTGSAFQPGIRALAGVGLAATCAFVAFRILQPYAFQGPGILGLIPAPRWLANGRTIQAYVTGQQEIPYTHQWADRLPILFPLSNLVIWGTGPAFGLTALAGWLVAAWQLVRARVVAHVIPVVWTALIVGLMGTEWVMYMRYFLPVYPTLAVLAGWMLVWLWDRARRRAGLRSTRTNAVWRWTPRHAGGLLAVVLVGTVLSALAFVGIYGRPNPRVQATQWITDHLPSGTTVANESPWDDSLPLGGNLASRYPAVNLDLTAEDSPAKLQQLLLGLDQAKYLFISSNRQYGSLTRLPDRFPLVGRYYDALFSGQLGFTRVADFTSYPGLFGIQLPDQGAEESWTVYDHPRVQIFRKTDAYSRLRAEAVLGAVNWGEVVRLPPKQETDLHHLELLSPAQRTASVQNGTSSAIFPRDSLANRLPVVAWAILLVIIGLIGLPLMWLIAAPLPDRGAGLARPIALLLVSWFVWWAASAGLTAFSASLVGVTLGSAVAVAAGIVWWQRRAFLGWLKANARLLILEEALFWGAFLSLLLVRWLNPDLWHPALGGEKPMDFAYLNAVIKSAHFPPYDPWFAGGSINYYYFGLVPMALLVKVTGIMPSVGYNLAIPTLFAFLVAGAFSVTLSLLAQARAAIRGRQLVLAAVLGALFLTVVGNLAELRVVVSFLVQALAGHASGFHIEAWYWDASRVIGHPATEPGPITEFPAFTVLFADLHAHLLALPYTLAVLGLTIALLRARASTPPLAGHGREGVAVAAALHWALLTVLALCLGALWAANSWDFPTYAVVVLAGLALAGWRVRRSIPQLVLGVAGRWIAVLLLAYALYLPFHLNTTAAFAGIQTWQGTQTPLSDYLTINGLFLFCLVAALAIDFWSGPDLNPVARTVRLALRRWSRLRRVVHLHRLLVRSTGWYVLGVLLAGVAALLALGLLASGRPTAAIVTALMTAVALLFVRGHTPHPATTLWQMTLLLVFIGLGLTLAAEFFVPKDIDIGRMNTVFKLYLQTWTLFAIGAAVATSLVVQRLRRIRLSAGPTIWWWGFSVLFGAALLYPLLATPARISDRFDRSVGATLDGARFMERARYLVAGRQVPLAPDGAAIQWMQDSLPGSPVIAEVNTFPVLYGWGNRYADFTGNPAVIGWDWHQRQQRPLLSTLVTRRIQDIQLAYRTTDLALAYRTLAQYGVQYIVVGPLEGALFPQGLAKWQQGSGNLWTPVYRSDQVVIYRMLPVLASGTSG
jgi:YYY domain-containing protein